MKTDVPKIIPSLISALKREPVSPLPVWLMRQAGRYLPEYRALRERVGSFWTLCDTPEFTAEATLQPMARFDLDAAIVFSDILTVPAALGQKVRIEEGLGPKLGTFPGVAELDHESPEARETLQPVYHALADVRTRLPRSKALLGFAGAPWTLATYMLGENGSPEERKARAKVSVLDPLLHVLAKTVALHLAAQLEAGANAVQIFDSWAGGLNDREFADWVIAPTAGIVSFLREQVAGAHVIGFPRGATIAQYAAYARDTGVDGLSIDSAVPVAQAVDQIRGVALQGNLDPAILVAGGAQLDAAVDGIVDAVRGRPFIFNLGHGVLPETPPEHVAQLVNRVHASRTS